MKSGIEEKERVARETKKRAGESEAKRKEKKAKEDREEQEALDDIFAMYDLQLLRRELVNDIPTILVTFRAKPDYRPKTAGGKLLQHIAGKAWIAEDDHELAKVEAEIIDPISIVAGFLAKVQKGSTLVMERRKINNEIWLPFREEGSINGKLLPLKASMSMTSSSTPTIGNTPSIPSSNSANQKRISHKRHKMQHPGRLIMG